MIKYVRALTKIRKAVHMSSISRRKMLKKYNRRHGASL